MSRKRKILTWEGEQVSQEGMLDAVIAHCVATGLPPSIEAVRGIIKNHAGTLGGITARKIERHLWDKGIVLPERRKAHAQVETAP